MLRNASKEWSVNISCERTRNQCYVTYKRSFTYNIKTSKSSLQHKPQLRPSQDFFIAHGSLIALSVYVFSVSSSSHFSCTIQNLLWRHAIYLLIYLFLFNLVDVQVQGFFAEITLFFSSLKSSLIGVRPI